MTFQLLEQDMANAIGFVMDRTSDPPRYLAQGFLVSKSRFVTTAGEVFHYPEAPWALSIYFPHPDVTMGVKSVSLHNDFDKVAARNQYLAQTGYPNEVLPVLPNDMALLIVDNTLTDPQPDKVAELHRAMSLPFQKDGVESSGNIRVQEFLQVINSLLEQNRQGLITLLDEYNRPIARVQLAGGTIPMVYYRQSEMLPAYAFFELVSKQPARGFMFQPSGQFPWPEVQPIAAPADRLVWEAMRRTNELSSVYNQLGGPEARYQRVVQSYDPSSSSEEIRWMAGRLWDSLDGFITLGRLGERVGADSYSCAVAVRELINRGVISQINRRTPFHCNGTAGPPLTSHTDFEVNNWDNLQCFYLDPLSGRPIWLQGNYFGSASAAQPKNMLHTVPVPAYISGALICKDYKLIGLHSGPQSVKAGQAAPPVKCYQFMWMGALLELSSAKKLRSTTEVESGEELGGVGGLRSKLDSEVVAAASASSERIICPVCFASNHSYGACSNCGNNIEAPPPEPDTSTVKGKAAKAVKQIHKKTGLTQKQLLIAAGILVPLFLMVLSMMPRPQAAPPPDNGTAGGTGASTGAAGTAATNEHPSSDKATEIAVKEAGFRVTTPPDYWYEDTSALTAPNPSFGVYSERTNQKLLFVEFNDLSPMTSLMAFTAKPPYTELKAPERDFIIQEDKQVLGDSTLNWMILRCSDPKGNAQKVLLAAFPNVAGNKAFLVVGQAFTTESGSFDPQMGVSLIDQFASDRTAKANKDKQQQVDGTATASGDEEDDSGEPKVEASDADLKAFFDQVKEDIKGKLDLPDFAKEELKKDKAIRRKWKIRLTVGVDTDGNVKRLEKQEMNDEDLDQVSNALQRAVNSAAPFKNVPHTKKPEFMFLVKLSGDKVKVERFDPSTGL